MPLTLRAVIAGLTLVAALVPGPRAAAYSYGNPNQEALADAYTAFAAAVAAEPRDWTEAGRQVTAVAEEVRLHFGPCALQALAQAVGDRDAEQALRRFRELLVLNVARRVEHAASTLGQDYVSAKTLLAKAYATYEALSPLVKAEDAALDARLRQDFDAMLGALGNPGLFGVGKRDPDPEEFARREQAVLAALQARFGPERLDVGHFVGEQECPPPGEAEGEAPAPAAGGGGAAPARDARGLLWLAGIALGAGAVAFAWWRWIGADER